MVAALVEIVGLQSTLEHWLGLRDWYCMGSLLCFVGFTIPKPKLSGAFLATSQKAAQLKRPKEQPRHAGEFHRFIDLHATSSAHWASHADLNIFFL